MVVFSPLWRLFIQTHTWKDKQESGHHARGSHSNICRIALRVSKTQWAEQQLRTGIADMNADRTFLDYTLSFSELRTQDVTAKWITGSPKHPPVEISRGWCVIISNIPSGPGWSGSKLASTDIIAIWHMDTHYRGLSSQAARFNRTFPNILSIQLCWWYTLTFWLLC